MIDPRSPCSLRDTNGTLPRRPAVWLARLCLVGVLVAGPGTAFGQASQQGAVKACFEGPARAALDKLDVPNDAARIAAVDEAASRCADTISQAVQACLASIDALPEDERDHARCIGVAANICIESEWASDERRKVACALAEEKVWLASVDRDLAAMRGAVDDERKALLKRTEEQFYRFRDGKCALVRSTFQNNEPLIAQAACVTESAARFALDMRDLRAHVSPEPASEQGVVPAQPGNEGRDGGAPDSESEAGAPLQSPDQETQPPAAEQPEDEQQDAAPGEGEGQEGGEQDNPEGSQEGKEDKD